MAASTGSSEACIASSSPPGRARRVYSSRRGITLDPSACEDGHRVTYMRVRGPVLDRTLVVELGKWLSVPRPRSAAHRRYLRRNRVGCVNLHYPSLVAVQFVLARALFAPSTKISVLSRPRPGECDATEGLERRTWRRLMQAADAIVCCSNSLANTLTAFEPSVRRAHARSTMGSTSATRWQCGTSRCASILGWTDDDSS